MQLEEISFQYRGKTHTGVVAVPENMNEAVEALGERDTYKHFLSGYIESQKKTIRAKRVKKHLKIEILKLNDFQKEALKTAGLLE